MACRRPRPKACVPAQDLAGSSRLRVAGLLQDQENRRGGSETQIGRARPPMGGSRHNGIAVASAACRLDSDRISDIAACPKTFTEPEVRSLYPRYERVSNGPR